MERRRLTITLKKDLLDRIDNTVDGARIRNRSHAIEYLISKAFPNKVNKALILAGGAGVKMRPLTYELPKPMIPVKGKPILEYIINNLRDNDIRDIVIGIGPLGNKIKEYFADGTKFGVKITYIEENTRSGTASPLKKAKPFLGDSTFVLYYGDVLADINIREMIDFHEHSNAQMTMAITSINETGEWGVVSMRGNDIVEFKEKPHKEGFSKLINAGVYVVEPSVIDYIPKSEFSMLEEDVFPLLIKRGKLMGYNFDGLWFDIATPKIYENALKLWER